VAYKDAPANTQAFLARVGDPYAHRLVDRDGRAGVGLGVTGVPETYLVDGQGVICREVSRAPVRVPTFSACSFRSAVNPFSPDHKIVKVRLG